MIFFVFNLTLNVTENIKKNFDFFLKFEIGKDIIQIGNKILFHAHLIFYG